MNIIKDLNENNIEWVQVGNEQFPIAISCLFCRKTIQGNPYFTFNIDSQGYGNCNTCKSITDWKELSEKIGIIPSKKTIIEKEEKIDWKSKKKFETKNAKGKAIIKCFTDIKSIPISWLWEGRIALGKLTMIAGDPGLGKSLLTATLAAHVSRGFPWPVDNSKPKIGDVILLSAEDDAADTIKPRLEAMEADCSRVHVIETIQETNIETEVSTQRMFSFKQDVAKLEELLVTLPDCALIIIDPVSAYLDSTDSNNNSDIRGLLAPLAELASKHKVAIVLVSHLNKNSSGNASYRIMGSLAFTAAVRTAYIVTKDKDNPKRRLLMPLKNNIAKDTTGLAYEIVDINGAPVISWELHPVEMTAEEALAPNESEEEPTLTDCAIDFLLDILSSGSMKVDEIQNEAKRAGISQKPLRSASAKLNIKPKKVGFNPGYWMWALPEDALKSEDVLQKREGNFDEVRHLREAQTNNLDNFVNYLNPDRKETETIKDKILPKLSQKPPDQGRLPI